MRELVRAVALLMAAMAVALVAVAVVLELAGL